MFAGDLPSGPVVKSHASTAQIQSLVGELRFPHATLYGKREKK